MGVEWISDGTTAVMVCNTTDWAFGPILRIPDEHEQLFDDISDYVIQLLKWLPDDPRRYSESGLIDKLTEFNEWLKTQAICQACSTLCHKLEGICDECKDDFEEFSNDNP